jgi:hypothetical protein
MKETRAIVLGLVVVVIIAFCWSFFRRPAAGMKRVRSFRVEIRGEKHGEPQNISLRIPGYFVGKAVQMASKGWERAWRRGSEGFDFDGTSITPKEILEAADRSRPGSPATIEIDRGRGRMDVSREGASVRLSVHGEGERHGAEIVIPRALIESLAQEEPLSPREVLARIDQMGPGDLVSIKSDEAEVRVTAEGR